MNDTQLRRTYFSLFIFFISTMMIVIAFLFFEYRFLCGQVQEVLALKEVYANCIDELQKKMNCFERDESDDTKEGFVEGRVDDPGETLLTDIDLFAAENSDEVDDDDDYADDTFVVINRQPDYLRQSAIDYVQSQDVSSLVTSIDVGQWTEYAEQKIVQAQPKRQAIVRPMRSQSSLNKKTLSMRAAKECGFMWPIEKNKFWLSSLYGPRKRVNGTWGFHHGIDMAAIKGTDVKAVRAGTVIEACFKTGYGNTVVLKHNNTLKTRYAHLHTIRVHEGQSVRQGAVIGTVGETGFVRKKGKDGSHLHFEVYENDKRVNPLHCLPRMTG